MIAKDGEQMAFVEQEEIDLIEQSRSYKVTKANTLIQKTRFHLSLQEQRIIAYLTAQIEPSDSELKTYTFEIKRFCDICGLQADGMYDNLKEVTQKLSDKSFWFAKSADEEILLRWISSVRYQRRQGTITICISEDMRPFLLDLKKQFTTYHLFNILAFKSRYSLRVYELLKSYANLGTWEIDILQLKKMVDAEQYVNFKDFRNRVLNVAQKEIQKFADINFTYEAIAQGRRVDRIKFLIVRNPNPCQRLFNVADALDKKRA